MKTQSWFDHPLNTANEIQEIERSMQIMAGTVAGGKAAAKKNKKKYGADFYQKIGAKGGKKGHTGGFFANRDLARQAGAKGGSISRRVVAEKAEDN